MTTHTNPKVPYITAKTLVEGYVCLWDKFNSRKTHVQWHEYETSSTVRLTCINVHEPAVNYSLTTLTHEALCNNINQCLTALQAKLNSIHSITVASKEV